MKLKKTTKKRIKKALTVFAFLYIIWHLGRYYEHLQFEKTLTEFKQYTIETYYFTNGSEIVDPYVNATSDLFVVGEIDVGRCLTREGIKNLGWFD